MDSDTLLTDKEAASYLRVSTVTLWRLRKSGKLAFRRVLKQLRYRKSDLDEYLESTLTSAQENDESSSLR